MILSIIHKLTQPTTGSFEVSPSRAHVSPPAIKDISERKRLESLSSKIGPSGVEETEIVHQKNKKQEDRKNPTKTIYSASDKKAEKSRKCESSV